MTRGKTQSVIVACGYILVAAIFIFSVARNNPNDNDDQLRDAENEFINSSGELQTFPY